MKNQIGKVGSIMQKDCGKRKLPVKRVTEKSNKPKNK